MLHQEGSLQITSTYITQVLTTSNPYQMLHQAGCLRIPSIYVTQVLTSPDSYQMVSLKYGRKAISGTKKSRENLPLTAFFLLKDVDLYSKPLSNSMGKDPA